MSLNVSCCLGDAGLALCKAPDSWPRNVLIQNGKSKHIRADNLINTKAHACVSATDASRIHINLKLHPRKCIMVPRQPLHCPRDTHNRRIQKTFHAKIIIQEDREK